jgi:hypothetical protein
MDVIIFKLYACNFGAFKSISPPSACYLNRIKCSGVEGLSSSLNLKRSRLRHKVYLIFVFCQSRLDQSDCVPFDPNVFVNFMIRAHSKGKAVPLHAMEALGRRGGIAPTHSRPRH